MSVTAEPSQCRPGQRPAVPVRKPMPRSVSNHPHRVLLL